MTVTAPWTVTSGYWDTQSGAPSSPPGAGKYRADNWAAPALVAVSGQDGDGYDRQAGLIAIKAGDTIIEQSLANSQNFQQWTVVTVTDQGTWAQFAVTVAGAGSAFAAPGMNQKWLLQAVEVAPPPGQLPPAEPWVAWAPPLDPPTAGGLPYNLAASIADVWWDVDPHYCAALQWEAYAATLAPTPTVATVSTGAQSVSYSPAAPTGEFGLAMQRAAWHRSFVEDQLLSVPLAGARDRAMADAPPPWGWWPYG